MKNAILYLSLFVLAFGITIGLVRWCAGRDSAYELDLAAESAAARAVAAEIRTASDDPAVSEIPLRESDLRALVLDALSASRSGSRLLEFARDLDVTFVDGDLQIELLLSSDEIAQSFEGDAFDGLLRVVRLVSGSNLRLGVRGRPTVRSGELGLEPQGLEILVGPLRLDADDLEDRIGFDASDVADGLRLAVGSRRLAGLRQVEGALVLALEPSA